MVGVTTGLILKVDAHAPQMGVTQLRKSFDDTFSSAGFLKSVQNCFNSSSYGLEVTEGRLCNVDIFYLVCDSRMVEPAGASCCRAFSPS